MVRLQHIKPNFTKVIIQDVSYYFSYETVIAVDGPVGLMVSKNEWSQTTGKHLNWISDNKKIRVSHDDLLAHINDNYGV